MPRRTSDKNQVETILNHVVARIAKETDTSSRRHLARKDRERRMKLRASRFKLGVLLPTFLALTVFNATSGGTPALNASAADDARLVESALSFAVTEVESYRDDNGGLPMDLSVIDLPEFGTWQYDRRDGTSYVLEVTDAGVSLRFDSLTERGASVQRRGAGQ